MELVVGASEATMNSLLSKLGGLLAQEYTLIRGVRGDIQYIKDELSSMQAFLLDIARDCQDHRKKYWMKQIRDMAYDCEDCIDDFAHRLPNDSKFDGKCCSSIVTVIYDLWTAGPRREIASNIAELKVRAQLIAERRIRYGVENPKTDNDKDSEASSNSGPSAATYDIAEHQLATRQIIGMKQPVGVTTDMTELEKWVNKPDVDRAVLSIIGFGGVGKTTIAMALYRKVMNEFECRASVTVSQNYDHCAVLRDILKQVQAQDTEHKHQGSTTGTFEKTSITSTLTRTVQLSRGQRQEGNDGSSNVKEIETMNLRQLENALTEHLKDKRYIILVDDIWSAKTWESISRSLPAEKKNRSRIIVTSRFQAVCATCSPIDTIDLIHTIGFLSNEKSKELFDQSVSEAKSSKHSDNVQNHAPKDLWKRCGGLPLAIVTMAGLVACNRSQSSNYWDKVCKLLPEQENSLTLHGVTRILDCCYNDLRGDLKTCALYLSIFPKGWKISRKCLTRRWIAEGFVSEKQGLTEEEVAETYFNQLLRRKLIRPVEHSSNGKLKTFQVHDMVLEYIVSKAREENFITVVGGHWMMPAPTNKVRRLSMQSGGSKQGDSTKGMNLSQVRSLTLFGSLSQLPFQAFNNRIIQVLDLDDLKGLKDKHLDDICKMLVLKYLSLRRTDITKIPSTIEKLEYLETLDIRDTNVRELPTAVGQLKLISSILGGSKNPRKGLRILPQEKGKDKRKNIAPEKNSKNMRKKILPQQKSKDEMKGLRILSGIEIVDESTEIESLHELTGLRKLAIYKLSIQKDGKTFNDLRSAIVYLCSCGLQTLAINDEFEGSDFINSLDHMSTPPRYLIALELSGKLERPPEWIKKLDKLNKLTLSVTVLRTATLNLLCNLKDLFSLTFSLSAANKDPAIKNIIEENKSQSDGEIFVPDGGFKSLKLLRLFAPHVPKLGFSHNAMPALEIIEMQFQAFEGLFGVDTLQSLKEVHLREAKTGKNDQDDENNELLVGDLKYSTEGLEVIVDHTFTS